MHYGIKGQKWGVRNGPPYPLNSSSRSEKAGRIVDKGKEFVEAHSRASISSVGGAEEVLAIAAPFVSYVATFTVANLIARAINIQSQRNELRDMNAKKQIKSFREAPKLSKKKSPAENMKEVNPDFPLSGTTMNCTFCTIAMALRERGYNVKAKKALNGKVSDDLFKMTYNSKEEKIRLKWGDSSEQILRHLESIGDGAYGNLVVDWLMGGSHSVFWKNENGKVHIYDGQSGKEYTSDSQTTQKFLSSIYYGS